MLCPQIPWLVSISGSVFGSALWLWRSSFSDEWGDDGQGSKAVRIFSPITVRLMLGEHFHNNKLLALFLEYSMLHISFRRSWWSEQFEVICCSVVSDSLWHHGLQHTRSPHPSLSPGVCPISRPLSQWCYPTIFILWEQSTHWKRPRCWERLKAKGEGGSRGWDGWNHCA